MNRKGEASWIESRQRWQLSVQKDGVRKCFTSTVPGRKGKHEAEAKADSWLKEQTEDVTVGYAIAEFLKDKARNCASGSVKISQRTLEAVQAKIKPLRKLSSITLREWREALYFVNKGHSKRTAETERSCLVALYNFAQSARWEMEPLSTALLPISRDAAPPKQRRALTEEEIQEVMSLDEFDSPLSYGFQFCLLTGLRIGEMRGLQWQDIDHQSRILHLSRAINAEGEVTTGKTVNAQREIPLTEQALAVLRKQKSFQESKGVISQWVFDKLGNVYDLSGAEYEWRRLKCSKLHTDITVHELRHTFISEMKSTIPLPILKQVVGHSASMDTLGVYGHSIDGDMLQASTAMQEAQNKLKK